MRMISGGPTTCGGEARHWPPPQTPKLPAKRAPRRQDVDAVRSRFESRRMASDPA
ncbi:hypothetical protein BDW75DRAFT_220567 [Aspergillus navahoensis]